MKPVSTKGLIKFARHGVNYGIGAPRLAARLSYLAFPHRVSNKNARRLTEEIMAQGTFGRFYVLNPNAPVRRVRPTR